MKMVAENKNKQAGKLLFYFAIALLIISVIIFFVNLARITKITGKVTGTGTANLTVESMTKINFTTDNINWGSGSVTGLLNATLDTSAGANNVTRGNWTGNTAGLILENLGNKNVTLLINAGKNAATLLEGSNPFYKFNFTNVESNSCTFNTTTSAGVFYDANTTQRQVCNIFNIDENRDTLRIDVQLVIPTDSKTGAIGDIITATATAI